MKLLYSYKNGNYDVMIFNDGTKVRQTQEDRFTPVFPENIDLKISNQCDLMCPFCHENSTPDGKNAIFTHNFLKTLRRGTEIACISGDSVVYNNYGAVEVKNLKNGDYIFDSDNILRKIVNINISNKDTFELKGDKGFNIKCSKDHPFISEGTQVIAEKAIDKKMSFLRPKEKEEELQYSIDMSKYIKPANVDLKNSRGGAIIDENYVRLRNSTKKIPKTINITNELMYLYGWFVAEGSSKGLSMNINEYDIAVNLGNIWNNIFGNSYKIYTNEAKHSLTLELQSPTLIEDLFINEMKVGKGARNKSIEYLFSIENKEFIRQALLGLFDGDGCFRVRKQKNSESMIVSLKTTSKKLAYEVIYLLAKYFGVYSSIHYGIAKERKIEDRILAKSDYYQICIYNYEDISKIFPERIKINKTNSYAKKTNKFKALTKIDNEILYDITLEEGSHIFPVNGYILTHNCGGGDVFANTEFIDFLKFCKQRGIVANITINQQHAAGKHKEKLKLAIKEKLVFGVGISYNNDYKTLNNLYNEFEKECIDISNIVIHTINGINTYNDFEKIASKNRKILILGYKDVRKGTEYRNSNNGKILVNQFDLFNNIEKLSDLFKVVSFDNLAIEQLEMKRFFDDEQWAEYYMGDEGQFTMYIDLVKEEFAINSCEVDKRHELLDTIDDMFSIIMKESDELQ